MKRLLSPAYGAVGALLVLLTLFALLSNMLAYAVVGLTLAVAAAIIFLYKPLFGLLPLVLVYPLIDFELRGLPLAKIYALGLVLLLLVRLLVSVYEGDEREHFYLPLLGPYLVFIAAGLLSAYNSVTPGITIFRVLIQIVVMYVVVLVVFNTLRRRDYALATIGAMIVIGVISALLGWLNYFQGNFQAVSSYFPRVVPPAWLGGTHVSLAELLVVLLPLVLPLALMTRRPWLRLALLGVVGLFAVTTTFTLSRAGWICLAMQIPLWLWVFRRNALVLATTLFGTLVAGVLALGPMQALLSSRIRESSDLTRDYLADLAVALFREHPLVGVGFGTFSTYNRYAFDSTFTPPLALDAHGVLYKVMSEMGLLGLVGLGLIWAAVGLRLLVAHRAARGDRLWQLLVTGCAISMLVSTTFELSSTRFFSMQYWFPIGVYLAVARLAVTRAVATEAAVASRPARLAPGLLAEGEAP